MSYVPAMLVHGTRYTLAHVQKGGGFREYVLQTVSHCSVSDCDDNRYRSTRNAATKQSTELQADRKQLICSQVQRGGGCSRINIQCT